MLEEKGECGRVRLALSPAVTLCVCVCSLVFVGEGRVEREKTAIEIFILIPIPILNWYWLQIIARHIYVIFNNSHKEMWKCEDFYPLNGTSVRSFPLYCTILSCQYNLSFLRVCLPCNSSLTLTHLGDTCLTSFTCQWSVQSASCALLYHPCMCLATRSTRIFGE